MVSTILFPRQPNNSYLRDQCLLGDFPLYHTVKVFGQRPGIESQSFSRAALRKLFLATLKTNLDFVWLQQPMSQASIAKHC